MLCNSYDGGYEGPAGFTVNDTRMQGAVALFPGLQLMWKVQVMEDITIESLELFVRMNPKIDVRF